MLESLVLTAALAVGGTEPPATTTSQATTPPSAQAVVPPATAARSAPVQQGPQPSAYRGRHFRAWQEPYRRCVAQREGRFQYWATGANGRYEGTYQFTDALARGAAWMMQPELRRMHGSQGVAIARELRRTPMRHWHRYYQDMAFFTVLNAEGVGSGARHWAGGRFACPFATRGGG